MIDRLDHRINKPVLVSMPSIFEDGKPRVCKLINVEPAGLWLENNDLTKMAFPNADERLATVFVPFTQIAYLGDGMTAPAVPAAGNNKTSTPSARQRRRGRGQNARAASPAKER
jgi:hypothetical protein